MIMSVKHLSAFSVCSWLWAWNIFKHSVWVHDYECEGLSQNSVMSSWWWDVKHLPEFSVSSWLWVWNISQHSVWLHDYECNRHLSAFSDVFMIMSVKHVSAFSKRIHDYECQTCHGIQWRVHDYECDTCLSIQCEFMIMSVKHLKTSQCEFMIMSVKHLKAFSVSSWFMSAWNISQTSVCAHDCECETSLCIQCQFMIMSVKHLWAFIRELTWSMFVPNISQHSVWVHDYESLRNISPPPVWLHDYGVFKHLPEFSVSSWLGVWNMANWIQCEFTDNEYETYLSIQCEFMIMSVKHLSAYSVSSWLWVWNIGQHSVWVHVCWVWNISQNAAAEFRQDGGWVISQNSVRVHDVRSVKQAPRIQWQFMIMSVISLSHELIQEVWRPVQTKWWNVMDCNFLM